MECWSFGVMFRSEVIAPLLLYSISPCSAARLLPPRWIAARAGGKALGGIFRRESFGPRPTSCRSRSAPARI